jgi:hypothetical protein
VRKLYAFLISIPKQYESKTRTSSSFFHSHESPFRGSYPLLRPRASAPVPRASLRSAPLRNSLLRSSNSSRLPGSILYCSFSFSEPYTSCPRLPMLHLSLRHRRQPPRTPPALPRPSGRPPMPPPPPLVLSAPSGCSLALIPKSAVALVAVQYLDPPAAPPSSASSMRPTNGGWVHTPISFGPLPDPTCTPSPPPCLRPVPNLYPDPVLPLFSNSAE